MTTRGAVRSTPFMMVSSISRCAAQKIASAFTWRGCGHDLVGPTRHTNHWEASRDP